MIFDNRQTVIGVRIKLFTATIVIICYLILTYMSKTFTFPFLGIEESVWTLMVVVVYIFIIAYPSLAVYQFIYFSDEGESLIIRYFTAGIIGGRKNSVEIPKAMFKGYALKREYLGVRQYIILYQNITGRTAQYPPIYISVLNKKEKRKLFESLDKYSR